VTRPVELDPAFFAPIWILDSIRAMGAAGVVADRGGQIMGRALVLWLVGIPIPFILLLWFVGGFR